MDSNKELTNENRNLMTFYREMDTIQAPIKIVCTLNKKIWNGFTYICMLTVLS